MKARRIVKVNTANLQFRAKCMECEWEKGFPTEEDGSKHVESHKLNHLHEKVQWWKRAGEARGRIQWEPFEPVVTPGARVLEKVRKRLQRGR